jgi:hypothetical protein
MVRRSSRRFPPASSLFSVRSVLRSYRGGVLRRLFKLGITVGVVGGLVYVIAKAARSTPPAPDDTPPSPTDAWTGADPAPAPVVAVASAPWVDPVDGGCPGSHPVKGKLKSKIFHLPGMLNYDRTSPDRCYLDAGAAVADGLRAAKR